MKSKLFVPASRPELFPKAAASHADALSFDLEDAVAAEDRPAARRHLAQWLKTAEPRAGRKIIVRVNAPDTTDFLQDLQGLAGAPIDIINLPKVEHADAVRQAVQAITAQGWQCPVLVNIETAQGLRHAADLAAAHPRVCGLQLGLGDLLEPLGIARYESDTLHAIMLSVRLAAGASGKYVLDAAYPDVGNADGFRAEAELSRRLGFLGKSCIHPSQVDIANAVYAPGEAEVAQAHRIVEAARQAGRAAFLLDGKMIDPPFVRRAEDILLAAGRQ